MTYGWDKIHSHIGGIAGLVGLYKQAKEAGENQGSVLKMLDPAQSTLNEMLKISVQEAFETHIKSQPLYKGAKERLTASLFPTSQAVIDKASLLEKKASQLEHTIHSVTSQHKATRYLTLGTVVFLGGWALTLITLNPVKLFIIAGIFFSIVGNLSALTTLLKDVQRLAMLGKNLLRQPLEARIGIKRAGRQIVEAAYQDPKTQSDPHAFHFASVTQMGIEKTFGTRDEFEKTVEDFLEDKACRPIRNFEKRQRFELISRIADAALKKLCVIGSTQAFRMTLTNMTGLGLVAILYWGTHYHLDTDFDHCEWWTPLAYTWNRLFPFSSSFYQHPEMCQRYVLLNYISDITKWGLRFYIWNKMIWAWEASRETAVDDLMRPVKDWSVTKWNNISRAFRSTTQNISNTVFGVFESIGDRLSGTVRKKTEVVALQSHVQRCYTIEVSALRETTLDSVTTK